MDAISAFGSWNITARYRKEAEMWDEHARERCSLPAIAFWIASHMTAGRGACERVPLTRHAIAFCRIAFFYSPEIILLWTPLVKDKRELSMLCTICLSFFFFFTHKRWELKFSFVLQICTLRWAVELRRANWRSQVSTSSSHNTLLKRLLEGSIWNMKQRAKRVLLFDDDYFLFTGADMFLRLHIRDNSAEHAATLRHEC